MQITGYWYPKGSSARYDAEMHWQDKRYTLVIANHDDIQGSVDKLSVSNRVGNIPRRLTLADGSVFVTKNNNVIDQLIAETDHKDGALHFLHILETHKRWIATAFVLMLIISFVSIQWGLPWLSKKLAYAMPIAISEQISSGSLDLMDGDVLKPSQLPQEQQDKIREHFEKVLLSTQTEGFHYQLYFRQLDNIPNAFALPSGDVIISDALIKLADNQQEIDSVLLHEIGHVVHRHGLQQVIHSSFIAAAVMMLAGDTSGVQEMIIALPVFLLESQYSRENETEADNYAFEQMVKLGIDPIYFANMFEKMTDTEDDDSSLEKQSTGIIDQYGEFISTHPSSPQRMKKAREYSKKHFK